MNPFPGLRPYEEADAAYFFGREEQVDELISVLESERFVAVTGVSGSGKSSLIHAGLIPALKKGLLSTAQPCWRTAHMRPGAGPLASLIHELGELKINVDALKTDSQEGRWSLSRTGLVDTIAAAQKEDSTFALFLLVDQFEEIFRYARGNSDEADVFIELLLETTRQRTVPIYVVLTMRADFLGHCARFRGLPELINRSHFLIPRMTREDFARSIQTPAKMQGASFCSTLVERLLYETGDDPERLPLLQHALRQTWRAWEERGSSGSVNQSHYEEAGTIDGIGLKGALHRHAEGLFQHLTTDLQPVAQALFRCITERSREGKYLRRPCRLDRIARVLFAPKDLKEAEENWKYSQEQFAILQKVIALFADPSAFFLRPSRKTLDPDCVIDISHESIVIRWETLRAWADEEQKDTGDWLLLVEKEQRWRTDGGNLLFDKEIEKAKDLQEGRRRRVGQSIDLQCFNRFWVDLISYSRDLDVYDRVLSFLDRSIEEHNKEKLLRELREKQEREAETQKTQPSRANSSLFTPSSGEPEVYRDGRPLRLRSPVLSLQTVYFHETDREAAVRLGSDLYELLTRPIADPLAFGPSIPVRIGVPAKSVDITAAGTVVLIPVLGAQTRGLIRWQVLETLAKWHEDLGPGHVLPVPLTANWRTDEDELSGKQMLSMLYEKADPRRRTLDEIVLAVTRVLEPERGNVQLFVSHAKADLSATDEAARKVHTFVTTDTTGKAFFDANDLRPGESLDAQLDTAVTRGVLISIRGDAYSSRVWCQRELLLAKLNGIPTLSVEVLRRGELRSSPYGGNSPSLVWDGNPSRIVSQAMVEWLRAEFFRREALRIIEAANLPKDVAVVARPPELLDLAQGPLRSDRAQLVLHPDPELSVLERRVLKAARPLLRLATPTTAFRRLLSRRDELADVASPLEGMEVAMSLSATPDAAGATGFTHDHLVDATVHIARTLISAGAAIAYGGDFRTGAKAFTPLLAQLIQTYNQTASRRALDLHSYLAAIVSLGEAPTDLPLQFHHLKESPDLAEEALLPDPGLPDAPPAPFYFSDMRRVMEKHIEARIVLGGQSDPRIVKDGDGYGGRYPGVVEEAWRALQRGNPLYVAGGFGGAAGLVADLLEDKEIPEKLRDATWMGHELYAQNAAKLDAHSARTTLGLPLRMEDLADAIKQLAGPLLKDDEASLRWNGLSVEDNKMLFRTRDPVALTALISKGLLRVARRQGEGKLQIELVHDSLTAAENLDAVAIATLEGVPLGGAGAAIDQFTGGLATEARARGQTLVSLKEALIDADWLFLASLGPLGEPEAMRAGVARAASETVEQALRHGFQRIGIVTFGGTVLGGLEETVRTMLEGFAPLRGRCALVWYETDDRRFEVVRRTLEMYDAGADFRSTNEGKDVNEGKGVKLTTRRAPTRLTSAPTPAEPLVVTVSLEDGHLSATCLPPSSSAAVFTLRGELSPAELTKLSTGRGHSRRATPDLATLNERGAQLLVHLFGTDAAAMLEKCRDARMIVVHDTASSKVPFETMLAAPDLRPALTGGITRRLSIAGLKFEQQFAKPPKKGKLRVLLVANPTKDLDGAAKEAAAVRAILQEQKEHLDLVELAEGEATPERVAAELAQADILHYCGHAFFDGPEPGESGLILAGGVPFTGEDLRKIDPLPRMAFVNACEAGRVRGQPASEATAFAELFLRSGMEAYLGTYWEVGDAAAELFARTIYLKLATGTTLEQAVLAGRQALFGADEPDWANYMLFGGGNFRLVKPA